MTIMIDLPRDGSELPVTPEQRNSGFVGVRVTGDVQLQSWEISTFQGVYLRFATEAMGDWRDLGPGETVTSFQAAIPGYDSHFSWEFYRQVPTEGRLRIEAVENFGENWGEEKGVPASCVIVFYTDSSAPPAPQPPQPPEPVKGANGKLTITLQLVDFMSAQPIGGAEVTAILKLWSWWQEYQAPSSIDTEQVPKVVHVYEDPVEIGSGLVTQIDLNTFIISFEINPDLFADLVEEKPSGFVHTNSTTAWDKVGHPRERIKPQGEVEIRVAGAGLNLAFTSGQTQSFRTLPQPLRPC